MQICVLIDNLDLTRLAGAETSAVLHCKEILKHGHQVNILTAGPFNNNKDIVEYDGIPINCISSEPAGWKADYLLINRPDVVEKTIKIIKQISPDLIQTHNIHNYFSFGILRALKLALPNVPLVVTAHDHSSLCRGALRCKGEHLANMHADSDFRMPNLITCWLCQKHTFNPFKRYFLIKILNEWCDFVIFVSKALQKFYLSNGLKTRSYVIYSGTAINKADISENDKKLFRHVYDLREHKLIICGGRMKPLKGFHKVIEAMPEIISRTDKSILLIIYGDENDYAMSLKDKAKELGVSENVKVIGWLNREELDILMSIAMVGIVPSIGADALPRSVYEYMLSGLPTLATRVGGAKEIIDDGNNGYLIVPWDTVEITRKTIRLIKSAALREQVCKKALDTIETSFLISHVVQQRLDIYEKLLTVKRDV